MIDQQRLIRYAAQVGVELSAPAAEKCAVYAARLVEWNQKMNLTAITDPEGMLIKHYLDSLTAVPCLPAGAKTLIDVGTGAGFPGVVLGLCCPWLKITLLDSLQKRLTFLEELCRELELPVLAEYCLPFVKPGGRFVAMKGPDAAQELQAAARAIAVLGGKVTDDRLLTLPVEADYTGEKAERRLILVDKIAPTPQKYPRPSAKMAKQPL